MVGSSGNLIKGESSPLFTSIQNLILILILFFNSGCQDENKNLNIATFENEESAKPENRYITIIFNQVPQRLFIPMNEDKFLGGRSYLNTIATFRDNHGITQHINPRRESPSDTVFIPVENETIEIYFYRVGLEGTSFLFERGDEISVRYVQGEPQIEVLNRTPGIHDFIFESHVNQQVSNNGITPFESFFRYLPLLDKPASKEERSQFLEDHIEKGGKLLAESLIYKKKVLDSLYKNKMLSQKVYDYYNNKLGYINWSRLAKLRQLPSDNNGLNSYSNEVFLNNQKPSFDNKYPLAGNIDVTNIIQGEQNFLQYKFYQDFLLDFYMPNYFDHEAAHYSFSYGNFGGSYRQWGAVFDTIQKNKDFNAEVKKFLLYRYMNRIVEDLSPETIKEYYRKFTEIPDNEKYLSLLNRKYEVDSTSTSKLLLKDSLGESYFLEDILEKNNDRLIVLNFWGSWCPPCIEIIPEWNNLQKKYKSEKVLFISIAHEKDFNSWKNSKSRKLFNDLSHNYHLENKYSSDFIKQNHIIYIPRYILINKAEMVDANAPNPGTRELNNLINKYLSL